MRVSYNDLISGKAIKINQKRYLDTKAYVQPFIEIVSQFTSDIRYTVRKADTMVADSDIYPRVLIEAISSYPNFKDYKRVDCLVYGLDTAVPIWKSYRGFIDTHKNIFLNVDNDVIMDSIKPEKDFDWERINDFVHEEIHTDKLELLNKIEIPYDDVYIATMIGDWIINITRASISNEFGKVMLPAESVIKAYKLLYCDIGSPYYIPPDIVSSLLNIYEAFASTIADNQRDIINRFEKTALLEKILK